MGFGIRLNFYSDETHLGGIYLGNGKKSNIGQPGELDREKLEVRTPNLLGSFSTPLWVTWSEGKISVGRGHAIGTDMSMTRPMEMFKDLCVTKVILTSQENGNWDYWLALTCDTKACPHAG